MGDPDLDAFPLVRKGNSFEDFTVGQELVHHWGRTITAGDNALFSTAMCNWNPMHLNAEYARAHGHPDVVVNPMLVLCTTVGLSVEDLSEAGGPFLGMEDVVFHRPVHPGDTITARSTVVSAVESAEPADERDRHVGDRGAQPARRAGRVVPADEPGGQASAGMSLWFEDFPVGRRMRHARSATIDEVENNYITKQVMNTAQGHWNEEAMRGSPLGDGRLVFGLITGSLTVGLTSQDTAENAARRARPRQGPLHQAGPPRRHDHRVHRGARRGRRARPRRRRRRALQALGPQPARRDRLRVGAHRAAEETRTTVMRPHDRARARRADARRRVRATGRRAHRRPHPGARRAVLHDDPRRHGRRRDQGRAQGRRRHPADRPAHRGRRRAPLRRLLRQHQPQQAQHRARPQGRRRRGDPAPPGRQRRRRRGELPRRGDGVARARLRDRCARRNPRLVYGAIRGFGDPRTGAEPVHVVAGLRRRRPGDGRGDLATPAPRAASTSPAGRASATCTRRR